jgi:mannose-6-phosphate isomerase-like protein (cupin superfamily)
MPVIRAADAVVHELHGTRFTSYASSASGSAELCVWRVDLPEPAAEPSPGVPHRISREEVFVIIDGAVRVNLDDASHVLGPGDVAVAPAGAHISIDNLGPGPASAWVSTGLGLEAMMADGSRISPPWAN